MRRADYIIDLGPGAGVHGGQVVAAGTLPELLRHPESITGQCLRQHKQYPTRGERRPVTDPSASPRLDRSHASWLHAATHAARTNNLKNLTVRFPLGPVGAGHWRQRLRQKHPRP